MKETKDKIKKLFHHYMVQVFSGLLDDPREFNFKTFAGTVSSTNENKTDIVIYDVYDSEGTHYGSITSEVSYDKSGNVTSYVQWAQAYGVSTALEFDDIEETVYDMISRRDKFNNIKI